MATRPWARWAVPALLGGIVLCVYLFSGSSDLLHNGDTDLRYQTTQAIVDHHRLWIAKPMWLDARVERGRGGHLYAYYAPGQTLLMVPLYVFGRFLAHHLSLPYDITTLYTSRSLDLILGACLAMLFFALARLAGYDERVAAVLTLILAFASVAWPDAQSALDQTQVNMFLLAAVLGLILFIRSGLLSRKALLVGGTALGAAIFTRYDAVLYFAAFGGLLVWLRWRSGHLHRALIDFAVLLAAIVPWGLAIALWNLARFGSPWQTGLHEQTFWEPIWAGLAGLLISPGKGLIWYLPLVFLLPWAVPRFYRRDAILTVACAVLVLVPLAFYANVLYWHGDPAWGPRYLYTAVPYLILPLGEYLTQWRRVAIPLRATFLLIVLGSLALQATAVSVNQWRFWYRLEAAEEHTRDKFRWGARYYHYYWQPRWSPILIQIDDLYQIARLDLLHDQRYQLTQRPTVCIPNVRCPSNPADLYPINTLAFWWADARHPLLGPRRTDAIAGALALVTLGCLLMLATRLRAPPTLPRSTGMDFVPERAGST